MEEIHYVKQLIKQKVDANIEKYKDQKYKQFCKSFEGIPKQHPTDKRVLILFTDPFSEERIFYEFSIDSIAKIEEIGTISSPDGKNAPKIRVWVQKGMPALKSSPFIIE